MVGCAFTALQIPIWNCAEPHASGPPLQMMERSHKLWWQRGDLLMLISWWGWWNRVKVEGSGQIVGKSGACLEVERGNIQQEWLMSYVIPSSASPHSLFVSLDYCQLKNWHSSKEIHGSWGSPWAHASCETGIILRRARGLSRAELQGLDMASTTALNPPPPSPNTLPVPPLKCPNPSLPALQLIPCTNLPALVDCPDKSGAHTELLVVSTIFHFPPLLTQRPIELSCESQVSVFRRLQPNIV